MNWENKLVSVIVPVYNTEAYLKCCLDSIIEQTYQYFEIILIDDGSTDKSGIICDNYALSDNRIKVIHKKNEGVSIARNVALDLARGEYFVFVDSDDIISKKLLELCINYFNKYDTDLVIYPYFKFIDQFNIDKNICKEFNVITMDKQDVFEIMFKGKNGKQLFRGLCWNKMYKRELFSSIRFPEGRKYGEDSIVTYKIVKKIDSAVYLEGFPLYYYRDNIESALHKKISINNLELFESYNDILMDVKKSQFTKKSYVSYSYIIRFFEFVSRIKLEIDNENDITQYLFLLKDYIKLNLLDVWENQDINIVLKLLFTLFKININIFKKLYWKI